MYSIVDVKAVRGLDLVGVASPNQKYTLWRGVRRTWFFVISSQKTTIIHHIFCYQSLEESKTDEKLRCIESV